MKQDFFIYNELLKDNANWLKEEIRDFKKAQKDKSREFKNSLKALKDKNKDAQLADKETLLKGEITKQLRLLKTV